MKLKQLRIRNFQSFGQTPTVISLEGLTFLLGPNGSGKTAVLQALSRLFAFDRSLRQIRRTDFHSSPNDVIKQSVDTSTLWIEAQFEFDELKQLKAKKATVPSHFAHMRLVSADGVPRIRFRLTAQLDEDGEIEETLSYVIETDEEDEPTKTLPVSKHDRNSIHVHYLPARRDPADHVSYAASSLLGRALRSANWTTERETVAHLTAEINGALDGNSAVKEIGKSLTTYWAALHKGTYYAEPGVSFDFGEIDRF